MTNEICGRAVLYPEVLGGMTAYALDIIAAGDLPGWHLVASSSRFNFAAISKCGPGQPSRSSTAKTVSKQREINSLKHKAASLGFQSTEAEADAG
jgi:hypothetical protein